MFELLQTLIAAAILLFAFWMLVGAVELVRRLHALRHDTRSARRRVS